MSECEQFRDWLIDQDELDADNRRRMEAHLAACPGCAREAAGIRKMVARVQTLPVPEPQTGFWEEFQTAVGRRVAEVRPPRPSAWSRTSEWFGGIAAPWRVSALAAATALGLLLAFGLVKSHRPPRDLPPPEVLAVGEDLAIVQNLDVLKDLDLFEEFDVLEGLDLLRQLDGGGRPRLS